MKRAPSLITFLVVATLIIVQSVFQKGYSNKVGAPIQRTGSPVDGNISCNTTSCHTGLPVGNAIGWITSNIPPAGYITGTTYTITATATSATTVSRFGFEISPQRSTGALAGTIVITNASTTRLAGTGIPPKYVTHTTTGTDASAAPGSKTWTFNWTAPAIGTGTVTFYGAFNCANNNTFATGDSIFLSQLVVPENAANGWAESENNLFSFDAHPNPAYGHLILSITSTRNLNCSARLMDITGKYIKEFSTEAIFSGIEKKSEFDIRDVPAGIYFLQVHSNESIEVKKIIIL